MSTKSTCYLIKTMNCYKLYKDILSFRDQTLSTDV